MHKNDFDKIQKSMQQQKCGAALGDGVEVT